MFRIHVDFYKILKVVYQTSWT